MSDNYLILIPTEPTFVPSPPAIERARCRLASALPAAEEITAKVHPSVAFIDSGSNLDRISCPRCGAPIETAWWSQAVDHSCRTEITSLMVTVPCCRHLISLNDLHYDWPVGFAHFALEAMNPNVGSLTTALLLSLERELECPLRVIWAHY